jgi:hypothetical protein
MGAASGRAGRQFKPASKIPLDRTRIREIGKTVDVNRVIAPNIQVHRGSKSITAGG